MNREIIINDLALFADLGTDIQQIRGDSKSFVIEMWRNLEKFTIEFHSHGLVNLVTEEFEKKYKSFRDLLASEYFSDLMMWASRQEKTLKERVFSEDIPYSAQTSDVILGIDDIDSAIVCNARETEREILVTLIDGPAGIGKTSLLRNLSYRRAQNYKKSALPLILHVESRGRMLQNLLDLMAFSLQTLRLQVTYDQVPVLVRHGLICLAIDGFDELGDPNGYDLAWAQVNDLVSECRGQGSIILAGRETFIGEGRVKVALTSLEASDQLQTLTLRYLAPANARAWLEKNGWHADAFNSPEISSLFEEGSYALRPFFLRELSRDGVLDKVLNGAVGDLLSFLVNLMIEREAGKFGSDIEALTTHGQRVAYLTSFLEEVARDMADNQSVSIATDILSWITEIVASNTLQPEVVGILRNRASVVAFLENDERRGYRRFIDGQIMNYFVARSAIKAVSNNDVPKFIRRNIIGLEFLENFLSVNVELDYAQVERFAISATKILEESSDFDRTKQNIATLLITAHCSHSLAKELALENISLDDVYLHGIVENISLINVTINQVYCRSADMSHVNFKGSCHILSLIADESTVLPRSFPRPSYLVLPSETITDLEEMSRWVIERLISNIKLESRDMKKFLLDFPLFMLLNRLARIRSYWLKDGEERATRRILDDIYWPKLREILIRHELLVEKDNIGTGGRPSKFYHLRNKQHLIEFEKPRPEVVPFLHDLLAESMNEEKTEEISTNAE